ncbi:hypothetical protein RA2_04065 [Roseovarius sp. A-2]|uniref:hypothetical protein n=1 Tax=Roseovarius sp. A-2 TaxID=1570360 RepID=UPI0009B568EF|nr:hypothetical protein [Roseovarius sp. A-2]GAW36990.1 hypothetical protein RA2_04065 [Roseovarius sp. A-2]
MTDIQTAVEHDLSLIAGNLDSAFPECAPTMIIATGQQGFIEHRVIANIMVDYAGHVTFTGPVVEKAYLFLHLFNYEVRWHRGAPMTYTLCGCARRLSAHEQMKALERGDLL